VHGTGAGNGTTCHRNRRIVAPARLVVRTATWCQPSPSVPVKNTRLAGMARHGPRSIRYRWTGAPSAAA
jgi:hypothetical protein